ncbi:MAG: NinG protein [Bacteriophage sp.]|jgi:5-methylcytosine-specific restriction endonuclease McrA|nr:MAG: NinG protein [Bacteriophage sp.]UWF79065.1 MAG: NinG protein [Bacteriophage sp.]
MNISKDELNELVTNSISYSEVLRKMGYHEMGGGPWNSLKKKIKMFNIDTSHFKGKSHGTSNTIKYDIDAVLVKNSPYVNLGSLKKRLIKEKNFEYKCAICGIDSWQNKPISLHLDHINGINNDHRIENLRFLCPNCHSQTDTYCGRNIYK